MSSGREINSQASSRARHNKGLASRAAALEASVRPVLEQLESRTLLSVSIINGAGSGYVGNGAGGPPDVTGAAGPSSYLEITNDTVTLFSPKPGGAILAQHGINDFFFNSAIGNESLIDSTSRGTADSTGTFDNLMGASGRFIIGNIDVDTATNVSQYIFAVSTSSNPTTFTTADWNFYHVTTTRGSGASQAWTDYPGNPGFNADAFVETFNMAQGTGLTGNGQVVAINASDLAAGVPQASLHFFNTDISGSNSYRATVMQDSVPGGPMWLIRNPNNGTNVNVTRMDNVLSGSPTFTTTSLALPAANNFSPSGINNPLNSDNTVTIDGDVDDDANNPGNSPASDIDNRILNAGEYNNTIVAAHKVAVGTAGVVSASVPAPSMTNPNPGGSGYAVGDTLTVTGGTFTTAATLMVATLGAGGSVATVTVANPGSYSSLSGINGTVTGGGGSGATFGLNFNGQLDVQWYAINVSGTPAFQQVGGVNNVGRIGFGANTYSVEPAININSKGEIGLGFMESDTLGGAVNAATGGFLSTFVTARLPTDAAGTMQPVVLVSAGTGSGTITGRIGDFSGMNVDPVNGTFWHVNEFGGASGPTVIANFTPEARPTVTAPADQIAVEGASKSFNLGSFTDPDGSPWSVKVDWGDGATDSFSQASTGSLGTRAHTYAEEGGYIPTVTVTDSTGLSNSATFNVSVSDPAVVAIGGIALSPVEGADTGTQTVATFTDPGGAETGSSDYSATINWGDGLTDTGNIVLSGGTFSVQGHHTYAEESAADHLNSNPYTITVVINHESTTAQTVTSSATVSDPAVVPIGGATFTATEGTPSALQTVATFTDPGGPEVGPGNVVTDYAAVIAWGDGSTSPGIITANADGSFTVQGAHTYATGLGSPGDYGSTFCDATPPHYSKPITVTISHESAPLAVTTSTAVISAPPNSAFLTMDGNLIVVGNAGDDLIVVTPVGNTGQVNVQINSKKFGPFALAATGRIVVAGLSGNDDIQIAGGIRIPTVLFGGPGNDRVKAGNAPSIEYGCDGNDLLIGGTANDLLIGGTANDLLIGGTGADSLIGTAGNDTLVAGETSMDYNTLLTYQSNYNLLIGNVTDDGSKDVLTGSSGNNVLFYHYQGGGVLDIATGRIATRFNT
jgi:Ca2+-binding RTX toxin-like protein